MFKLGRQLSCIDVFMVIQLLCISQEKILIAQSFLFESYWEQKFPRPPSYEVPKIAQEIFLRAHSLFESYWKKKSPSSAPTLTTTILYTRFYGIKPKLMATQNCPGKNFNCPASVSNMEKKHRILKYIFEILLLTPF